MLSIIGIIPKPLSICLEAAFLLGRSGRAEYFFGREHLIIFSEPPSFALKDSWSVLIWDSWRAWLLRLENFSVSKSPIISHHSMAEITHIEN